MTRRADNTDRIRHDELPAYLRSRLERDAPPLSPELKQRLRAARITALERRREAPLLRFWKPLASCATAAVLVLTVAYINTSGQPVQPGDNLRVEAEVLFSDEDLQLYEDLEFYTWLADNDL